MGIYDLFRRRRFRGGSLISSFCSPFFSASRALSADRVIGRWRPGMVFDRDEGRERGASRASGEDSRLVSLSDSDTFDSVSASPVSTSLSDSRLRLPPNNEEPANSDCAAPTCFWINSSTFSLGGGGGILSWTGGFGAGALPLNKGDSETYRCAFSVNML